VTETKFGEHFTWLVSHIRSYYLFSTRSTFSLFFKKKNLIDLVVFGAYSQTIWQYVPMAVVWCRGGLLQKGQF